MVFGGKNSPVQPLLITVMDGHLQKTIETCNSMKILGVIVDDKLNWDKHVKKVKQRTQRITSNLARTTHVLPLKSRRTLYDALVTPHFNYCDVVWGGISTTRADTLQKTGNFAAKALLGMKKKIFRH